MRVRAIAAYRDSGSLTPAWKDRAFGAVVVTIAIVMRLPSLLYGGLWRDQANVYVQQLAPTFGEFAHRLTVTEFHPPLYFVLAFGFMALFGKSAFAYLALPFLFSIATVGIAYRLGTSLGSRRIGAIAAVLYAIAPIVIEDATNYLYPQVAFFSTSLALAVVRFRRERMDPRRWMLLALLSACVIYTHYVGLIFLPIVVVVTMLDRRPLRERLGSASAVLVGLATFVFWSPIFFAQRSVGTPYVVPSTPFERLVVGLDNVLHGMPTNSLAFAAVMFGLAIALTIVSLRAEKLDRDASFVGGTYALTVAVASLAGLLEPRYTAPLCGLLFVYLAYLANAVLAWLERVSHATRLVARIGTALVLSLVATDLASVYASARVPRSGISALSAAHAIEPNALYVIAPDYLVATFAFYTQGQAIAHLGFARIENSDVFALDGYERLWEAPDVVDRAMVAIARSATARGRIHYIVDVTATDRGRMRYGKTWQLLDRLRATYALEGVAKYRGRQESIADYRFVKRNRRTTGPS